MAKCVLGAPPLLSWTRLAKTCISGISPDGVQMTYLDQVDPRNSWEPVVRFPAKSDTKQPIHALRRGHAIRALIMDIFGGVSPCDIYANGAFSGVLGSSSRKKKRKTMGSMHDDRLRAMSAMVATVAMIATMMSASLPSMITMMMNTTTSILLATQQPCPTNLP